MSDQRVFGGPTVPRLAGAPITGPLLLLFLIRPGNLFAHLPLDIRGEAVDNESDLMTKRFFVRIALKKLCP